MLNAHCVHGICLSVENATSGGQIQHVYSRALGKASHGNSCTVYYYIKSTKIESVLEEHTLHPRQ